MIASILNCCCLGWPSSYGGKRIDKPFIEDHKQELEGSDIRLICHVNLPGSLLMLLIHYLL